MFFPIEAVIFDLDGTLMSPAAEALEGVADMLSALKKHSYPMGIFTARGRQSTLERLSEQSWLGNFFEPSYVICSDEGFAPKPAPDGLIELTLRMAVEAKATLYVGDQETDVQAGRGASVVVAAALWYQSYLQNQMQPTQRQAFKEVWQQWDKLDVDLRLISPSALTSWLCD